MSENLSLNTKQRTYLRSLAHHLKPVVIIGKEGVTQSVIESVNNAFINRELLKVKVLENAPESARESVNLILENESMHDTLAVQVMGRIITLFRPNRKNPKIVLPS